MILLSTPMARKKTAAVLDSPPAGFDDRIDQLTSTVETLAQEVRILREAIDELREVLDWTMKNREAPANHPLLPITSLPRDPGDENFGEKINCTPPDDLTDDDEPAATTPLGELF